MKTKKYWTATPASANLVYGRSVTVMWSTGDPVNGYLVVNATEVNNMDEFEGLLFGPLASHFERLKSAQSSRQVLDIVRPTTVHGKVVEGLSAVRKAYAGRLSSKTRSLLDDLERRSRDECASVRALWEQLDKYERFGTWEAIAAGALSEETAAGLAIGGSLFGPLGAVVGGAIGGWMAGSKIDSEIQRAFEELGHWLDRYLNALDAQFEGEIKPAAEVDLAARLALPAHGNYSTAAGRSTSPLIALSVVLVLVLLAVGVTLWLTGWRPSGTRGSAPAGSDQQALPPTPSATPDVFSTIRPTSSEAVQSGTGTPASSRREDISDSQGGGPGFELRPEPHPSSSAPPATRKQPASTTHPHSGKSATKAKRTAVDEDK
jgi:hypothetical protein